jgi:DNA invertase Pin-like site-specific DNA recombinase
LLIGYARVSTTGQTLTAQLEQLQAAGCDRIFQETASGARKNRPELAKALEAVNGGTLLVTRLDRLARSTLELLSIVAAVEAKGGKLKSLAEAWADTSSPAGRLLLTILGGLAEFERSLILERTTEGRTRAQRRGVRFGRPASLTPEQKAAAVRMYDGGSGESFAEIGRIMDVDRSIVSRAVRAELARNKETKV